MEDGDEEIRELLTDTLLCLGTIDTSEAAKMRARIRKYLSRTKEKLKK